MEKMKAKLVHEYIERYLVESGKDFRLKDHDPCDTHGLKSGDKPEAKRLTEEGVVLLSEMQDEYMRLHPKKPLPRYVFPGSGERGHVVEVKKAWRSICKAAGITGLRIHDLRHSFASQLASGGASLPLIGSLLGHTNPATTARYAHLFDDPQRKATESVGAIITAAGKPPPAPPVELGRGRRL